ncbi:MAG: ABC transporter permease [Anaerolineae bacterium]|nr:ABC transporter permease [Anaerolineae bacterium]
MKLRRFWDYVRVVRVTALMTFRQNVADMFILFAVLFQPLIIVVMAMWMLKDMGGDYAIWVVVGSGMTGLWSSLLFVSGNSITGERWVGTLEYLVSSPTPMQVVVFGKTLSNVIQSLFSMVLSYALVSLMLGTPINIAQPGLFAISVVFTTISFISFGLIIAAAFVVSPEVQRWQNGLEFPIYILAGFLFPIALLPGWTTPLSYLLPPYWAAQALHATAAGTAQLSGLAVSWGVMLGLSVVLFAISGGLFRSVLRKARVDATLGMQ